MKHPFHTQIPPSPQFPQENHPTQDDLKRFWGNLAEEEPSPEEREAAQQLAQHIDACFHPGLSPSPKKTTAEEIDALLSYGMLMRHAIHPPVLQEDSKRRIEQELLAMLASDRAKVPVHAGRSVLEQSMFSGWDAWIHRVRAMFGQRLAWVMMGLCLCLGTWGLYRSFSPTSPPSMSVSSWQTPQSTWFGGEQQKPGWVNPFAHTRSASERLGNVTQHLKRWQRDNWSTQIRIHRYRS